MSDELKASIKTEIAASDDPKMRTVLLFMLNLFESIDAKLDALVSDKEHQDDHEWIRERRNSRCDEACAWAETKMTEERQDNQERRKIAWDARSTIITTLITAAGTVLVMWISGGRLG